MSKGKVNPIPGYYQRVIPYLIVKGASDLMEFLKTTFNAEETERITIPDGTVAHGEVKIGDSTIMLSEATEKYKENPTMLYIYIEDVDSTYKKALDAGATSIQEPWNEYYGDRICMVKDASGNSWAIASHIEDVPPDEMQKRAAEAMSKSR
ncbi:MAG: VOC family protein [Ignavibacteriae bacterium]|nr:VOC family protein [Ignavibacteriota bacterium]MCB9243565.1 VOC family protein [Ignavibacteriales bacterium]